MTSIAKTVIVVGILFLAAGWLASPTSGARATRRYMAPTLRLHPAYVYTGLALVVCFYFLTGPTQGLRTFLTTLIVAGMAAFGIHELRRQTEEEFPEATYDEIFGGTRDKVVSAVKDSNIGERVGEQASRLRLPEMKRPGGEESGGEAPTRTMPAGEDDVRLERLERLGSLRDKGILTDEEFAAEKARLLGGGSSASKAPRRNRTGNLLITNEALSQVELGGQGGDDVRNGRDVQILGARRGYRADERDRSSLWSNL